ncbi:ATP-binding cassette domain-containing protein [Acidobacteria bacterium AH-259-L09]|nr:ATP-binding cassette domain-containing protein [Acidobacteria bacterium AH-259-L09]
MADPIKINSFFDFRSPVGSRSALLFLHSKSMLFKFFVVVIFLGYLTLLGLILVRQLFHPRKSEPVHKKYSEFDDFRGEVVLELQDVEKSFDHPVLKGINLKLSRGQTLGVLGKSGSGKSVALKLIAGLLKPDRGHILFKGKDITTMSERELLELRKRVSYVFQGGAVFDFLNVRENIAYPLREMGISDEERIRERVDYLLTAVEMENMGDLHKDELSSGSNKQVAIARAIANNPEMILYDEPTTGVDPIIKKSLSRLIRKVNKQEHLTSIVVTHDLKCTEIVADRIILLKDGGIHFEGNQEEFHASSDPYVQAFIAGKRFEEEEQPLSA